MTNEVYATLKRAGFGHLREQREPFTFQDLRHSFGTLAVQVYPVTDVQVYMVHEKIETTMRYVHFVPKVDAAAKGPRSSRRRWRTCPHRVPN